MTALLLWPFRAFRAFRHSIAYLPSLLALGYWLLGWLVLLLPRLTDAWPASLARSLTPPDHATTLLAALLGGMISLVVFSFSMVMSVLSQAGGQFSHKLVFGLISERRHQWVLGHYLGSILFILMLLLAPADTTATPWHALAVYLACALVIHCLALFVFFIHGAAQSIRIDAVTRDLHRATRDALARWAAQQRGPRWRHLPSPPPAAGGHPIAAARAGYVQGADLAGLARLAERCGGVIHLTFRFGDYAVEGVPLLTLVAPEPPDATWCAAARAQLHYGEGESIGDQPQHGMTELMEVAIKALSPGINDPGTARLCIHHLTDLLRQRLDQPPCNARVDADGRTRVVWPIERFDALLYRLFAPILHYGGDDLSIGLALLKAVKALSLFGGATERDALQALAERLVARLARAAVHPLDRQFVNERLAIGHHRLRLPVCLPQACAPDAWSASSAQQRHHEQHQEQHEQNLCDGAGDSGDAREPQYPGDDRDDQKQHGVAQHR